MPKPIQSTTLPNGLTLIVEPMPGVRSVSLCLLTPGGVIHETPEQAGLASLSSEMLYRGTAGRSAKAHAEALDRLGVRRDLSVETRDHRLSASLLADHLPEAMPLLTDMIRRPNLESAELPPARDLCLQAIDALADDPYERAMLELRRRHHPDPFGRSPYGQTQALQRVSLDDLRAWHQRTAVPKGAVLALAGQVEWDAVLELVTQTLGDWAGPAPEAPAAGPRERGRAHVLDETQQVQVTLAYDAPAEREPQSLLQRMAVAVLSGGTASRLFTEVREKRGLCYSVYASYFTDSDRGGVMAYVGATPDAAGEALTVVQEELHRLGDGVLADEFTRAKVGMKSRLVMQGESTGARAHALAGDWRLIGRPRALAERAADVDALTLEQLNAYLAAHRPGEMTIVTLGPALGE